MKAVVLGAGNIGSVAAMDFAGGMPDWEVTLADLSLERARHVLAGRDFHNLHAASADVASGGEFVSFLRRFDLVVSALPGSVGFAAAQASMEAGRDLVDVSFSPEDPFLLESAAARGKALFIPDCGVAPGLSNALVGRAVSQLDSVETVHVMVGGLPVDPHLPLGYIITWSVEGLIDEYTRKARVILGGRQTEVEALSGVERIEFPGVGTLEAFLTDGARTLFRTVKPVKEMWEKTLRYPGHVDAIRAMRDIGLFDETPREISGAKVVPRDLAARLLDRLRVPGAEDLLAMRVDVTGTRSGKTESFGFSLLDSCDKAAHTSAMARTTAFTASVVAQMVARSEIVGEGILTPEEIGMKPVAFDGLVRGLAARGVNVK